MIQEFKDFIARGNVMDMAVGIIIGAAFTAIVTSMVADLVNPFISLILGGLDFSGLFISLDGNDYATIGAADEAGGAVFAYGRFIMALINFLIVAFVVFLLVKAVNRVKERGEAASEPEEEEEAAPSELDVLIEIRDMLSKQGN